MFKPGDRVKIVNSGNPGVDATGYTGKTGTVIEQSASMLLYGPYGDQVVVMPDEPRYTGDEGYWWPVKGLERIERKTLDDLREVVSDLRAQGMQVEVLVTREVVVTTTETEEI